jgi:hypothetical protein
MTINENTVPAGQTPLVARGPLVVDLAKPLSARSLLALVPPLMGKVKETMP